MPRRTSARRTRLVQVAQETISVLPDILQELPNFNSDECEKIHLAALQQLDGDSCPGYEVRVAGEPLKGTRIRVLNQDTLDAAIDIAGDKSSRVAILNLASEKNPGGGWRSGALAQEEAICYRSSLYLTLHRQHYPLEPLAALYSPNVVVIRDAFERGHGLLVPDTAAAELPVLGVVSVAAIRRPPTRTTTVDGVERVEYANAADRDLMKEKMRLTLRISVLKGHSRVVLGAMGCGAFRNPPLEVAQAWREVLREPEFKGGWWDELVFAVLDKGSDPANAQAREGNFDIFQNCLDGRIV